MPVAFASVLSTIIPGKSFACTAAELLENDGKPAAGGVADPGQPFNSDTDRKLAFPTGHVGRPQRSQTCIAGYQGFRPQTTPIWDN